MKLPAFLRTFSTLQLALGVSIAVHAALITVRFVDPEGFDRAFKDSPLDVRQIAERLNARYVMGGMVRKSQSGIRVTAHLTDARTGAQLWAETYDKNTVDSDMYAIQDEVTDRVVSTVADKAGVLARSMVQARSMCCCSASALTCWCST